jgi:hypothetical protein
MMVGGNIKRHAACRMLHAACRALGVLIVSVAALGAQSVPTPASHFGFEIGSDRHLANWTQLTAYYSKLARASKRIKLDTLGQTTLGKPFVMLTITSEANQARLKELHDIQRKLADPRQISGADELQRLLDTGKNVVMLTHSIHSTEVGGAQMAARLDYKLASSTDPAIREILDNLIILQIPSLNPDGTQWVSDWYMQHVGTPYEGTAPPWLYHFYTGHDNNRDWYAFTQKETQATVRAQNDWHPQIVHDIHQMGNTGARIYFPPYTDPVEPNVDPALTAEVNQMGTWMAADLIGKGKTGVVVNAMYDQWTPARAYMHYHGGARILSETASADLATPVEMATDRIRGGREYDASTTSWKFPVLWQGGRWGLPEIVDYQEQGALALLTNAAKNRRWWLENFYHINKRAVDGWKSWPAAWVIPSDQANRTGLSYVARILTMGDVEMYRSSATFSAGGRQFAAGSYVIPMQQPYASFAETLLEVQNYPDLREYPGGPPKRPYDVTAHTLPLLMNVQAVPVTKWDGPAIASLGARLTTPPAIEFALPAALRGPNAPRIGLYKSWQETIESGWTRWTLDQHKLVYDTLHDARMRAGNLRRDYDVIIIQTSTPRATRAGYAANALPADYTGGLGDAGVKAVEDFVRAGARLITIDQSTDFAIDLFKLGAKNVVAGLRGQDFYVPGSILKVDLDTTSALTRGMRAATPVWFSGDSRAFDVSDPAITIVARYATGNPKMSGWILGPEKIAGKPALLEAKVGQGSVVLFGFQPDYRGQSVATWPMFFNAMTVPRGK